MKNANFFKLIGPINKQQELLFNMIQSNIEKQSKFIVFMPRRYGRTYATNIAKKIYGKTKNLPN